MKSAQLEKSLGTRGLRAPKPRTLKTMAPLEGNGKLRAAGKKKKGVRVDMSGSGNPVKNSAKVGVGGSSEELSLIEEEPRR